MLDIIPNIFKRENLITNWVLDKTKDSVLISLDRAMPLLLCKKYTLQGCYDIIDENRFEKILVQKSKRGKKTRFYRMSSMIDL